MAINNNGFTPIFTVGIEKAVNDILNLLRPTDESSLGVVIYGFEGIGKTTLAEAVLAKINLHHYNYTKVALHQEEEKNDYKSLQQQILKSCFPTYNNGKPVEFTDCKDGRHQLLKASKCQKAKPIFLFIDNAWRSYDLMELLPTYTIILPPGSRILLTTVRLTATNVFDNLHTHPYPVQTLAKEDALKVLIPDPTKFDSIENGYLERILKICRGVPLALKIISAHLHKQSCARLLDALESEEEIKEEKLSDRLVDFVYGELDNSTKEAFLDICCFFSNWRRQDVEHIVGAEAVTSLFEARLITSIATQKVDEELILHDIVIAKGRSLAKDNRIMDFESFCEAGDHERLHQIKGLWLANEKSNYALPMPDLSLMTKSLRVLALGDRMKFGKANEFLEFEELRFLRIGSSIPQLPVKLEALNNLKVFHGPSSIGGEVITSKLPKGLLAMKVMEQSVDK